MAAAPGNPPAVARQRVRRALRRARDETPLSQGDVAKRLGWSLSKMQRIEAGEVGVAPTDLRALLDVYGVTDPERISRLTADAHRSRRQRYLVAPEYREHVSAGLLELMQFEQEATAIRVYQPHIYPGFLQTAEVAEAILQDMNRQLPEERRRVLFKVRMTRRQRVLESLAEREYFLVIDESVIKRRIVNAKVSATQIEEVVDFANRSNVHVRMISFDRGAYLSPSGPFQVLSMDGDDDGEAVLYREIYQQDEMIHDPREVRSHQAEFEKLWALSLAEDATLRKLTAEAALLRSAMDFDSR